MGLTINYLSMTSSDRVMTPREKIEAITRTMEEPQSIDWIANQADIRRETVSKYVKKLQDEGVVLEVNGEYKSNSEHIYQERVEKVVSCFESDEIADEIDSINDTIDEWKNNYDVNSVGDLEDIATDGNLPTEEGRELSKIAGRWKKLVDQRDVLIEAHKRIDD